MKSNYFAPQGQLFLTDINQEIFSLGNCNKFSISGDNCLLKLDNISVFNLSVIFESAVSKKILNNIPFSEFSLNKFTKIWNFEFNGINTADFNAPFILKGKIKFTDLLNLELISNKFEPIILKGKVSDLAFAYCDGNVVKDLPNFLTEKREVKKDLAKINTDLFRIISLDAIFNRRDIVKISKASPSSTIIDFISTSIEVAEPFSQVTKFFERYEDEQKLVKIINQNADKMLDFLADFKDNNFYERT